MTDAMTLLAPALAVALVRFVWQGAAIGAFAWIALVLLRDARPQARYAVACLALLSCVLAPVIGLSQALASGSAPSGGHIDLVLLLAGTDAVPGASDAMAPPALPGIASPWIVAAWAAGVFALSLRMAGGLLWAGRMRRTAGVPDADDAWQRRFDRLAARFGIRREVTLRLVRGEGSPLTAGWLRPVVLLPLAVATRMPVDLVEALLAHEIAHVRRHDYLVNVLQGAVEALLFYHPVVWWLSRRIRIERELVADDLAADVLGDRRRLALALAELERRIPAHSDAFPSHLAPAAHGGQLMSRIQQLIRPQRRSAGALFALPVVGLALAGAAFYAQARFAAPAPAAAPAPSAAPAQVQDERDAYAFVRDGEDGMAMSGTLEDVDAIDAARERIDGDFLWFRRDGKAWIVRDADTIARARKAWATTRPLEKEMQALEARMRPHSERMQALGDRMQALQGDNAFDSPEGRAAQAGIEDVAIDIQSLAGERMKLARRQRHADSDAERAEIARAQAALDARQATLDAEMQRYQASMEKLHERMAQQQAPMQALSREMNATSEPMNRIGDEMSAVGKRIEREARVADREVRALIDQAYRDGRAEPAPAATLR